MAQYDLLLTQNIHATLVEFSEKYVNIGKGALLSAATDGTPTVLAVGANTYQLEADSTQATGLKWSAKPSLAQLHDQNTDVGTTSNIFELDSDAFKIELTAESATKFGVKIDGGATYADLQAKDATFAKVTVSAAPATGTDLTNKTYVDGLLATNDAMIFRGTIGVGGTLEIAAFNALVVYNAGWAYKVITAGTIKGVVAEVGDMFVATVDRASGGVDADWIVLQTNTDGAVTGPTSATTDNIATYNGITGKIIKDSGIAVSAIATAQTTANNAIPKAVFTATGNEIILGSAASTYAPLVVGASTIVGRKSTGNVVALTGAEVMAIIGAAAASVNGYMTSVYATKLDGIAAGATNNTKATAAEINTGTDDDKFATSLAIAGSTIAKGPASSVDNRIVAFNGTSGKLLKDTGKTISDFLGTWVTAPIAKTSTGVAGALAIDGNFFYVCTATNVWKRSPIATNW